MRKDGEIKSGVPTERFNKRKWFATDLMSLRDMVVCVRRGTLVLKRIPLVSMGYIGFETSNVFVEIPLDLK